MHLSEARRTLSVALWLFHYMGLAVIRSGRYAIKSLIDQGRAQSTTIRPVTRGEKPPEKNSLFWKNVLEIV